MIDDELKERIRDKCDIVDVIGQFIKLKRAGNTFKALCPFHNENTPSFNVNPEKQIFYCFGCHQGGDVYSFIMEHEGLDFPGALRFLAQYANIDIPEPSANDRQQFRQQAADGIRKDDLYLIHEKLAYWYQMRLRSPEGQAALNYCYQRQLQDTLIEKFQLGFAPDSFDAVKQWGHKQGFSDKQLLAAGVLTKRQEEDPDNRAYDRWRNRLMFPIWSPQGRVIGFSGRLLDSNQQGGKYVNSPETPIFHKSSVLYGLVHARNAIKEHDNCILCEGQMDVIACHAAGIEQAIAPQGTAFTEQQSKLIKRYTNKLLFAFDGDQAGINAVLKSHEAFMPVELEAKVIPLNEGEDPDSIIQSQGTRTFQTKIEQAMDYVIFYLESEKKKHDFSPTGKAQIVKNVLELITKLKSPIARSEYCNLLAGHLQLDSHAVFQELNQLLNKARRNEYFSERKNDQFTPQNEDIQLEYVDSHETIFEPKIINKSHLKAEGDLLDLCLNNEHYALKLLDDLSLNELSDYGTGKALNELLAHTANGEWDLAEEIFKEKMSELQCPELTKALIKPEYTNKLTDKKLYQCYLDCVCKIKEINLHDEIKQMDLQIQNEADPEKKQQLRIDKFSKMDQLKAYRTGKLT